MTFADEKEHREQIFRLVRDYTQKFKQSRPFEPGKTAIPPSGKLIGHEEIEAIVDSALDGWLTAGKYNMQFEKQLGRYLNVKHALTVNSGSSANLIAFSCLTTPKLGARAIRAGDEVITVAAGFPTTVNPIIQFGAVPVFVDIQVGQYNIDPAKIEEAITPRTKAIMLAHTLGNPFDLATIKDLCARYNLWLVEDSCDALGSTYAGKRVGSFGDVGTLSFYPAHHITMGEGGCVFTNNDELKVYAESFRDWGRDCYCLPGKDNTCQKRFDWQLGDLPHGYDHKYTYSHIGYNLKITDMQAACGWAQLQKLDSFVAARKHNFTFLYDLLSDMQDILIFPECLPDSDPSWFGFPITLKRSAPLSRFELIAALDNAKIGTRLLFAGNLTRQPSMQGVAYRVSGTLENTDTIMHDTFWVGVHPALNEEMLTFVAGTIRQALGR